MIQQSGLSGAQEAGQNVRWHLTATFQTSEMLTRVDTSLLVVYFLFAYCLLAVYIHLNNVCTYYFYHNLCSNSH